jgi:hypothetical protein
MRTVTIGVLVGLLVAQAGWAAFAEDVLVQRRDAQHRINLAGRQRMLSQRMAKAACFASLGIDTAAHIAESREAYTLFKSSLAALISGSSEVGLAPERDLEILHALRDEDRSWTGYAAAVLEFEDKFPASETKRTLQSVYDLNLPLLDAADNAVDLIEFANQDGRIVRLGLANTINVAGRQRMLSQKMSKEFCMIASGYKPEETRAQLGDTINLFVAFHEKLKSGLSAMRLASKDGEPIRAQLQKVEAMWKNISSPFQRAALGGVPTQEEVTRVAHDNLTFLNEIDSTVKLYEALDASGGT